MRRNLNHILIVARVTQLIFIMRPIELNLNTYNLCNAKRVGVIDILYTLDSASLLVRLKPRIFQRLPPFEQIAAMLVVPLTYKRLKTTITFII